ncbi:hypothetical protein D3C73_1471600 [compost metagenome]
MCGVALYWKQEHTEGCRSGRDVRVQRIWLALPDSPKHYDLFRQNNKCVTRMICSLEHCCFNNWRSTWGQSIFM